MRQLAGSQFCSEEHSQQHAAREKAATVTRLSPSASQAPKPARFAVSSPDAAVMNALPYDGAIRQPIPRYCDLILCRRLLRLRYTMGEKGAKTIQWLPGASAPPAASALGAASPENGGRLCLSLAIVGNGKRQSASEPYLRVQRELPVAAKNISHSPRNPAVSDNKAAADPFVQSLFKDAGRLELAGSRAPLLAPVALPIVPDAQPVAVGAVGASPRLRYEAIEPQAFPASFALSTTLAGGMPAAAWDGSSGGEAPRTFRAARTAEFAADGCDTPAAQPGFCGPLSIACDFPISPVWLPALFDEVGGLHSGVRRWTQCLAPLSPVHSCEDLMEADGPGFSGLLACPTPGAAICELPETSAPSVESEPVMSTTPQPSRESFRDRASRIPRLTPAFVRRMAIAVLLVAAALYYAPKIGPQLQSQGGSAWAAAIQARATVDLEDDFHAGFGAWSGKPGWESTWSLDGTGSAQPGRLALYRGTAPLTDYRLEFSGQILSKALGFVFRAADTDNYQAVKLVIAKPGPLASIALVRYAVIEGREGPKAQMPIALTVHSDTIYRLLVTVEGDHFTVTVNGQLADAWSDGRLKSGGVGFFADKGEVARLRSVHVIDKDDFLGQLCSKVSLWTADKRTIGVKHE